MVAGWLTVGTLGIAPAQQSPGVEANAELSRMAAQVEALKPDSVAAETQIATTAERIEQRQRFLDALLTGRARGSDLAGLLPRKGRLSPDAAATAGVLGPFAALEARQTALADQAAATARTRLRDATSLIARLGLSPSRFVSTAGHASGRLGMGGPFVPAGIDAGGADPRFAELFANWERVEQLEAGIAAIPAYLPAKNYTITSGFGFRHDPFNGRGAQHAGIDFAGAHGEPIYAAAAGRVVRAARFGAYGNTVDIDHGKGLMTRYAHLSTIRVSVGDRVVMGQRIGGMGSTGRSTGTHLHYEIRVDGQPVNPRPFLDSSRYILAFQQAPAGPVLTTADLGR